MGKRKRRARQASMWVATQDLPRSAAHPFYRRLNRVLDEAQFDAFVEGACTTFYAPVMGRPGLAPGRYFRLLLLGYFEGLDSERAIAWRAADSLSVRSFLGLELHEPTPDHSTISRTRRLIDLETHRAVFTWVLQRLGDAGLVKGKTIGIDATTLEANAALRAIIRRDTGENYQDFLTKLAQASGIETPTRADLARVDRKRKKKGSNNDWSHPHDPDAKITKMKDGRTHLAHKAEHAVDLETGAVVAVTVRMRTPGTTTSIETLIEAAEQVGRSCPMATACRRSSGTRAITATSDVGSRSGRCPQLHLGTRSRPTPLGRSLRARGPVDRNRRRIRGTRGKQLLRLRGNAWSDRLRISMTPAGCDACICEVTRTF